MGRPKKIKLAKVNQLEDLKGWISFFEENGKLPHKQMYCASCNKKNIEYTNAKLKNQLKEKSIEEVLKTSMCKGCIKFEKDTARLLKKKQKETDDILKKPAPKFLSKEEMEDRAEEIRKQLPKIDLNKPRNIIDLTKNKELCEKETSDKCIRPDVFLINRDCDNCKLNKWCKCPIKKFSKYYKK